MPKWKYTNKFRDKNINAVRHLMTNDNINSNTIWGSDLRGDYKKSRNNNVKKS